MILIESDGTVTFTMWSTFMSSNDGYRDMSTFVHGQAGKREGPMTLRNGGLRGAQRSWSLVLD